MAASGGLGSTDEQQQQQDVVEGHYVLAGTTLQPMLAESSRLFTAIVEDDVALLRQELAGRPAAHLNAAHLILHWSSSPAGGSGVAAGGCNVKHRTLLHICAYHGSVKAMTYLLANGANPAVKSPEGMAASAFAAQGNSPNASMAIRLLQEHEPAASASSHSAIGNGNTQNVQADHGSVSGAPFGASENSSSASPQRGHASNMPPEGFPLGVDLQQLAGIHAQGRNSADPFNSDFSTAELTQPEYSTDDFRMFGFKVLRCSKRFAHDWRTCPFAHPTENARRRDPREFRYCAIACPDYKQGFCVRGDLCPYSHGVFECWLHPSRYRTQLCKDGVNCHRPICFFAHSLPELRAPTYTWTPADDPAASPSATGSKAVPASELPLPLNNKNNAMRAADAAVGSADAPAAAAPAAAANGPAARISATGGSIGAGSSSRGSSSGSICREAALGSKEGSSVGSGSGAGSIAGSIEGAKAGAAGVQPAPAAPVQPAPAAVAAAAASPPRGAPSKEAGGMAPAAAPAVSGGVAPVPPSVAAAQMFGFTAPRMSNAFARRHGLNPKDNAMLNLQKIALQATATSGGAKPGGAYGGAPASPAPMSALPMGPGPGADPTAVKVAASAAGVPYGNGNANGGMQAGGQHGMPFANGAVHGGRGGGGANGVNRMSGSGQQQYSPAVGGNGQQGGGGRKQGYGGHRSAAGSGYGMQQVPAMQAGGAPGKGMGHMMAAHQQQHHMAMGMPGAPQYAFAPAPGGAVGAAGGGMAPGAAAVAAAAPMGAHDPAALAALNQHLAALSLQQASPMFGAAAVGSGIMGAAGMGMGMGGYGHMGGGMGMGPAFHVPAMSNGYGHDAGTSSTR